MTPLVMIPGLLCDARLYGPQIAAFSGRHTIHIPALTEGATISEIAHRVLCAAPLRFALAGLSMGGIIAMEILAQAPERVERIALLDTVAGREPPRIAERREPQIARSARDGLETVMRSEMLPHYTRPGPNREAIEALILDMALALGPAIFARQLRALRDRPDQNLTLAGARLPALVLCGEHDPLCSVDEHRSMHAALNGSTLEIISGTGHVPVLERPEAVNAALSRWLAA